MDKNETVLLYILIYFTTTVLAFLSQKSIGVKRIFRAFPFFVAFCLHAVFLLFTNIGVDYYNYYDIIEKLNTSIAYDGVEIGFTILCSFLKFLVSSTDLVIFFFKLTTLSLFYFCFYKLRKFISLGLCIYGFNVLIYLQGFYLLSIQMAISLLLLSFYYLCKDNNKIALLFLGTACSMHNSMFLFVPIYGFYYYVNLSKKRITKKNILFLVLLLMVVFVAFNFIYSYAIASISIFQNYGNYELITTSHGSGLAQFVFFLPVFYFVYQFYVSNIDYQLINIAVVFSFLGLGYALLGYKVDVLMRINMAFIGLYILFVPYVLRLKNNKIIWFKKGSCLPIRLDYFMWFAYLTFRGYIILADYFSKYSFSELDRYHFFNPFLD